jgi:hypothetical protein
MKKALNLIIMYFVFFIVTLLLGTLLYTLFSNLLKYVAGTKLKLFSVESLLEAYCYISFCILFLICPALSFYRIRHPGGVAQTLAYIIMCLFTWLLLFPVNHKFTCYLYDNYIDESAQHNLSKGYFRHYDDEVYYFTNDFIYKEYGALEADAVVIHTDRESESVDFLPIRDTPALKLNSAAKPFREILVSENFRSSKDVPFVNFKALVDEARRCIASGIIIFLFYLSFPLAICSLYALTTLFDWRLLNSVLLFLLCSVVLAVNSDFFSSWVQAIKANISQEWVYNFLDTWTKEPIIFVVNILFALILNLIWLITSIIKRHKKKEE